MKRKPNNAVLIACLLLLSPFAQAEKLVVDGGCNYSGSSITAGQSLTLFPADVNTEILIDKIIQTYGITPNFTVKAAAVDNATAIIQNTTRYILYNQLTFRELNTNSYWVAVAILAHEIAHHLNGDTLDKTGSRPDSELKADWTAGAVLHKMGATLAQATEALKLLAAEQESTTHPSKKERLAAMTNGFVDSENTFKEIKPHDLQLPDAAKLAADAFDKGFKYLFLTDQKEGYNKAFPFIAKAAELGDVRGFIELGVMYDDGNGVKENDTEAVKWYRKAADQGNARGQNNLARMYINGTGIKQDYAEAVKWYQKSADQGNGEGQNGLGVMYKDGTGVKQNNAEAVKWYQKSADQGNAYGQYNLGLMYESGKGVIQDKQKALELYREAAAQNEHEMHKANFERLQKELSSAH